MSLHVILHHLIFISNILTHLHSKSHIVKSNPIEKLHTFSLQTPQIFSPQKLPNSKHPTLRSLHHITLSILQNPSILRFELDSTHPKGEITQTQEIKWNSWNLYECKYKGVRKTLKIHQSHQLTIYHTPAYMWGESNVISHGSVCIHVKIMNTPHTMTILWHVWQNFRQTSHFEIKFNFSLSILNLSTVFSDT